MGGKHTVSGTYSISSKLCFPTSASPNSSLIQILTHGVGFDKSYWGFFSSEYSYQDAAALADCTTFSYDRLGIGASSHPDPIQDVQAPLEIAIAHQLIQKLRSGTIASTSFSHIVGVGHSLGSELTNAHYRDVP
jgi:pimeloyl-ACP methyl ester carboxylesterase